MGSQRDKVIAARKARKAALANSPPPQNPPAPRRRSGPELPPTWQTRFLEAYKTQGGLWRCAELAGVSQSTVRAHRAQDPAFDQACLEAREVFADTLEQRMIQQADDIGNPVGYIVRLKALRPAEYIERHAVMSLSVTSELTSEDAASLLRDMLGSLSESSRTLLQSGLPPLPPATQDAPLPQPTPGSQGPPLTPPSQGCHGFQGGFGPPATPETSEAS